MIDPENPETPENSGTPEMDDAEDGIEVSGPEVEFEEEYAYAPEEVDPPKKGLGLLPVLGLTLLAALVGAVGGAVGGAYGTQYVTPPPDVSALRAGFQKDIAQVQTQTKSDMERALKSIRADLNSLKSQVSRANPGTNSGEDLQPTLTAIDKRLQSLEVAPGPSLTDIDPKTISALKAAQKDGFKWPDTKAMETEVTELKAETTALKAQIEGLNAQIVSFETELETLASNPAQPSETEMTKFEGPVFPKQALLQAAKAKVDSQGLLARTLHKHVHVERPDSPKNLIDQIETAYQKGDVYTAVKTFDRLPSDIRAAGQDWRDAADRLK